MSSIFFLVLRHTKRKGANNPVFAHSEVSVQFPLFSFSFNLLKNENPAIQRIKGFFISFHQTLVELVGVEPTSEQGNHTLSTRLFQP